MVRSTARPCASNHRAPGSQASHFETLAELVIELRFALTPVASASGWGRSFPR